MNSPARILVVDDSPTILKVVGAILARHGFEPATARDGLMGLEMIKRGPAYDLVLLDFVMPRMNGYQFCRELRSLPEHKDLPVILMSAKGDKIRGQFQLQTGAVDAITKPFDSRALISMIEGALVSRPATDRPPQPDGEDVPLDDMDAQEGEATRGAPSMQQRHRTVFDFAQHLAAHLTPAILSVPEHERGDEAAIAAAITRAVTSDVVNALSATFKELDQGELGKEMMSGDISAIALAEILQILQMQRQSGVLRVVNNRMTVVIAIRQGQIDLVQTRGASDEFRVGRYFIERGLVTREQVEEIAQSRAPGQLLGETLVASGLISREDLTEALSRQSSELVYDVLRWTFGRFTFTRESPSAEAEAAKLGLSVSGLVLEGYRRVDEWRLMEGMIHFDQVVVTEPVMLEDVAIDQMPRNDQIILGCVDGVRTVSEVIRQSALSSFDAAKIIYQFLTSRILRLVAP